MALTDNIIGYWKMEGDSTDATGNGNNGTDTTITYSTGNGKIGQGAGFNGTSSKISLGTGLSVAGSAFTIAGWVYVTADLGTFQNVFSKRAAGGTQYQMHIDPSGYMGFFNGSSTYESSASAVATGQWVHIALTLSAASSGQLIHYVNGSAVITTNSVNLGSGSATTAVYMGNRYDGNEGFASNIDEFGIWSRALSGAEITSLYNSGAGFQYPFLTPTTNYLKGRKRSRVDFTGVSLG